MRSVEKNNGFSDMHHGFRKRRNTYHSAMSIIMATDIFRQAQTGFALVETDCKAASDCCISEIVKLSWLSKGVPPHTAELIYNHQTQTTYDVTAGGLVPSRSYGGKDTSFGNGQGGGISAPNWIASQDILNRALEKPPVQACIIRNPVTSEIRTSNGACFADDLSISSGSNITKNSPTTNINKLQHTTQLANDVHRASGGSFSFPKCSVRLVTTNKSGKLIGYPTTFSTRCHLHGISAAPHAGISVPPSCPTTTKPGYQQTSEPHHHPLTTPPQFVIYHEPPSHPSPSNIRRCGHSKLGSHYLCLPS